MVTDLVLHHIRHVGHAVFIRHHGWDGCGSLLLHDSLSFGERLGLTTGDLGILLGQADQIGRILLCQGTALHEAVDEIDGDVFRQ